MTTTAPCRTTMTALGTTAVLLTTDPAGLAAAGQVMAEELTAIDAACSRFRPDSEISRLHDSRGRSVRVGPLLAEAVSAALRAAELTNGMVDPTVGAAVRTLGYDRDFTEVPADAGPMPPVGPAPGWWRLRWDAEQRCLQVPRGIWLDLGATAKALAADRIAARAAEAGGCGVLVSLGGDVAVAGRPPEEAWQVGVADDHTDPEAAVSITLTGGGLATSGTTRRRWRRGEQTVHHIIDPRTGQAAAPCWRTATVVAGTCLDANTASTAAIVMGPAAPRWLAGCALPSRLVAEDGAVTHVAEWPAGERP
ncbi:MAG TPA: FAD:protein FMN transferase [Pseudonocardia sp.]